jgi:two-component system sensor histidine kinase/response regulator
MTDSKYTVLIVDDVPENIQVLSAILYQKGVNLAIAQSGKEALSIAARKPPDLILLDIVMPDMNGFDVCEHLKHAPETKEIPIIFLTARTQLDDILKGFAVGAVDYVTKPFNPAELLSRVFTHLELKQSRDIITIQNQQLAEQNSILQELNATKDKFFSIIAHDLKNPFNVLISLSGLLKDEAKRYTLEEIERYAQRLYQAAEQGYTLLENLLEWARSQTGRITFQPEKTYLKTLIADTIRLLESHAKTKQIAFLSDIPDDLVGFVDVKMAATVMRNLVSNALKYTASGGTVTIQAHDAGEQITIAVSDTGVGIAPEHLAKLFRIDAHHATPGTAQEKGTGLGLILCQEFLEQHGGTITVVSEVGQGSCFTITLPKTQ